MWLCGFSTSVLLSFARFGLICLLSLPISPLKADASLYRQFRPSLSSFTLSILEILLPVDLDVVKLPQQAQFYPLFQQYPTVSAGFQQFRQVSSARHVPQPSSLLLQSKVV